MSRNLLTRMVASLCLAALLAAPGAELALAAREYRGNPTTKVYHNSECKHYNCKKCTVVFKSAKAAQKAGYRPCGICNG